MGMPGLGLPGCGTLLYHRGGRPSSTCRFQLSSAKARVDSYPISSQERIAAVRRGRRQQRDAGSNSRGEPAHVGAREPAASAQRSPPHTGPAPFSLLQPPKDKEYLEKQASAQDRSLRPGLCVLSVGVASTPPCSDGRRPHQDTRPGSRRIREEERGQGRNTRPTAAARRRQGRGLPDECRGQRTGQEGRPSTKLATAARAAMGFRETQRRAPRRARLSDT